MRAPATVAIFSIVQCYQTVDQPFAPWTWTDTEIAAYGFMNSYWLILSGICVVWAIRNIVSDAPPAQPTDPEPTSLRHELRRHSRWRDR